MRDTYYRGRMNLKNGELQYKRDDALLRKMNLLKEIVRLKWLNLIQKIKILSKYEGLVHNRRILCSTTYATKIST